MGLPYLAEEGRKKCEVRAISEVMAGLAITNEGTPSMILEVDDDMAAAGRVSKQKKWDMEEMDFRMEAVGELIQLPNPRRKTPGSA